VLHNAGKDSEKILMVLGEGPLCYLDDHEKIFERWRWRIPSFLRVDLPCYAQKRAGTNLLAKII